MDVIRSIDDMRRRTARWRREGLTIGFVPTLGGLHEGHGRLMDASTKECDRTVVSIFVNALQFGEGEDFDAYPRDLTADRSFCRERGVHVVFAPDHATMYPTPPHAFVDVEGLGDHLCGRFRPGHFRGVATVVAKLFNIVTPDAAYFGQKDGQQLAVVRRLVQDLNMPVDVRAVPTVRESDGLAMSTRNRYLSSRERRAAAVLYESLQIGRALVDAGERRAGVVREAVADTLRSHPLVKPEYVDVVDVHTLQPISYIGERVMIAVAAHVGSARLIDNVIVPE